MPSALRFPAPRSFRFPLPIPLLLLFAACGLAHAPLGAAEAEANADAVPTATPATRYVFLCLGQSNMEGFPGLEAADTTWDDPRFQMLATTDFPKLGRKTGEWYPAVPPLSRPNAGLGPADYFGRTLVEKLPAHLSVGVVNVSIGGCRIELFQKDNFADYVASSPGWLQNAVKDYAGDPYRRLVEMAKVAQRDGGVIKGILLHQGESNTGDRDWPAKVKGVYENLLADLGLDASAAPLLAGEMLDAEQGGKCASMNRIIATLPETIPTAHVVSSRGCEGLPDGLHFSPAGYRELGRRYAETMLPLLASAAASGDAAAPTTR